MKIYFNPITTPLYHQTYQQKTVKSNITKSQNKTTANSLECLANQNIAFCSTSIYMINYDGSYEKFDTVSAAAKKSKINSKSIYSVLNGKADSVKQKTCMFSQDVEDDEGEPLPGIIKLAINSFSDNKKMPIYAINHKGEYIRFDNHKEASKELGIVYSSIASILDNQKSIAKGWTFISAFEIEKRNKHGKILQDQNGFPVIDKEKIKKAKEKFLESPNNSPIIAIDKNLNTRIFENLNAAHKELDITPSQIYQAIYEKHSLKGYAFEKLNEVVERNKNGEILYDANNNYLLDEEKIKKIAHKSFVENRAKNFFHMY